MKVYLGVKCTENCFNFVENASNLSNVNSQNGGLLLLFDFRLELSPSLFI